MGAGHGPHAALGEPIEGTVDGCRTSGTHILQQRVVGPLYESVDGALDAALFPQWVAWDHKQRLVTVQTVMARFFCADQHWHRVGSKFCEPGRVI